jgi:pentapeptide MXKDX repeat protein
MKNVICGGFVAVVLALSAAASAQEHKIDDKMKSETSYTGCIERSPDSAFTLGHAMASSATTKKSMGKDSMAKDSMAHDSMAHESMMNDAMGSTLGLASTSVDLARHVGHKVIVKGVAGDTMGGMATFTVKSIKMVGSSCS